jgi:hypothetical protein
MATVRQLASSERNGAALTDAGVVDEPIRSGMSEENIHLYGPAVLLRTSGPQIGLSDDILLVCCHGLRRA